MFSHVRIVLDTLSSVLVIVVAGVMLWRVNQPTPSLARSRPAVEAVTDLKIASSSITKIRGNGKVALVEFADYQCPFCARYSQTTEPEVTKQLVESGKIRQVFFNFPLAIHARAQKAGEAAECAAEQGRFWEMHGRLFEDPGALELKDLAGRAENLQLDRVRFNKCLEEGATAGKVRADLAEGRRLGVNSTPVFFVGVLQGDGGIRLIKRINGAVSFDILNGAVNDVLPKERAQR